MLSFVQCEQKSCFASCSTISETTAGPKCFEPQRAFAPLGNVRFNRLFPVGETYTFRMTANMSHWDMRPVKNTY